MNKKAQGQVSYVAISIGIFIAIIMGLVLFQASASNIGQSITSGEYNGTAVGTVYDLTAAGTETVLTGQELLSTPLVINRTGAAIDCSTNVTIAEGVDSISGVKRVIMTTVAVYDADDRGFCREVNVSYDYGPEGYIDSSGGRSIASLILIFFAVAIGIGAPIYLIFRHKGLEGLFGR